MKILFVCLGNICRSPMAEGILRDIASRYQLNWHIDSAGTEYYHVGEHPDRRAIRTTERNGIMIHSQCARRITLEDFEKFDVVYALATDVLEEIREFVDGRKVKADIRLLLDEISPGEQRSVPDPWYGTEKDFEPVFHLIRTACEKIIERYSHSSKIS